MDKATFDLKTKRDILWLMLFIFLFNALPFLAVAQNDSTKVREAPDIDRAMAIAKAQYPQVDSLDRISYRLKYFEDHEPSKEQAGKLIDIYKAIANGYAV